jgi:hypothetical protein
VRKKYRHPSFHTSVNMETQLENFTMAYEQAENFLEDI